MDLNKLMPPLDSNGLLNLLKQSQWQVHHGSIERFPEFLRPDDGALSNISKLEKWPHFHVAFRDEGGNYHQSKGTKQTATEYFERGCLVNARSIEELSEGAKTWLGEWAKSLGVPRSALRLNSWAVKGASGIDWHFDAEDVIHFQIRGEKLFKFLRTPKSRFADIQTKRFERILVAQENFGEASEAIVRAGTITVIPRGVWHWSEGKSDSSFAVSMCINPPTQADIFAQAINKRLRMLERFRTPYFDSSDAQCNALGEEIATLLQDINWKSIVSQEAGRPLTADEIPLLRFYIGKRANAKLEPARVWIDGREFVIEDDENARAVLELVCRLGDGFRARDLYDSLPSIGPSEVNRTLTRLVRIGLLDFV